MGDGSTLFCGGGGETGALTTLRVWPTELSHFLTSALFLLGSSGAAPVYPTTFSTFTSG